MIKTHQLKLLQFHPEAMGVGETTTQHLFYDGQLDSYSTASSLTAHFSH